MTAPPDDHEDALAEALNRAVQIIENAEARGSDPVLDRLEENAPPDEPAADE